MIEKSQKTVTRIGIYGGTFDPVHYAHLILAQTALESLQLDRLIFVPAGIPPHKQGRTITPGPIRFQMLEAATAQNPAFEVSRFEIDSPEVSYTVKTLEYFHRLYPDADLFLLTGSDTLADIPHWYAPRSVCERAIIATALRPDGSTLDFSALEDIATPGRIDQMRQAVIPMPLVDISATDLRQRAAAGLSLRYRTPEAVAEIIEKNGLYR